jgi:tripartite-type tricarboxylate transporter receptor subunit TctC
MKLPRRGFLNLAAGAAAFPVATHFAKAQAYPTRPVHIIVGFSAGGPTDILARLVGQWLSERLGQPFVIEDRPGAATNIATESVAHAPPDGYTLLAAVSTNTINPALYPNLNFNFIRDIAMVAGLTRSAKVLEVNPGVPITSVPELIAYVKANPGKLSLASFGTGTSHVAGVLFKREAGIEMEHVPYRGSAPLVVDLLAGQVPVAFDNVQSSIGYIKAGKLRALAVTSAAHLPWLFQCSATSCRDMRSPDGLASGLPRTRPSLSSISSIRRSTLDLPTLRSPHTSLTWPAQYLSLRTPNLTSSSSKAPRSGAR